MLAGLATADMCSSSSTGMNNMPLAGGARPAARRAVRPHGVPEMPRFQPRWRRRAPVRVAAVRAGASGVCYKSQSDQSARMFD
nr:unnamed protein product [Digitaria exilis]